MLDLPEEIYDQEEEPDIPEENWWQLYPELAYKEELEEILRERQAEGQ